MAGLMLSRTAFPWRRLLAGAIIVLWLLISAKLLIHVLDSSSKIEMALCVALLLAPFLLVKISRVPIYLLASYAAMVPFSGLLVTDSGSTITKMLAMVTGGALVLSIIATGKVAKPSRSLIIAAVLTAYIGATIFWSINPPEALYTFGVHMMLVVLYAAIALYPATPNDAKFVLAASIVGAIGVAAYGAYLFTHGQSVVETRLFIGWQDDTNSIDPNEYAASLLTPIALSLMMFLRSKLDHTKVLWGGAVLLLLYGLMVSGSRGGMIALSVILIFIMIRSAYRTQIIAMLPLVVIGVLMSPLAGRFVRGDVTSGDLRFDVWKIGLASLHQYWFNGAGFGNFRDAYVQYYLSTPHLKLLWDRPAHSILMQSAVELGVIGLVLVLAFWVAQFFELYYVRGNDRAADVCTALCAGVIGLFVSGISLDIMLSKYTWLAFSLIAFMRNALVRSGREIDPSPQRVQTSGRQAAGLAIPRL